MLFKRTQNQDGEHSAIEYCKRYLSWGAGPRAAQYLILARCLLHGRFSASAEDVASVAHAVMRHRIVRNFAAEAEGVTPDMIVDKILTEISAHAKTRMETT